MTFTATKASLPPAPMTWLRASASPSSATLEAKATSPAGWAGALAAGTGSLVSLPHFTAGRYEVQVDEVAGTCWANQGSTCRDGFSGLSSYRLVFMLGQFLHGMGATPLYTLGGHLPG